MRHLILLGWVALLGMHVSAFGQAGPTTRRSVMTPLRVSELKQVTVMYAEVDTTLEDIAKVVSPALEGELNALQEHGATPAGAPVLEYEVTVMDPGKTFKMRIGFPVADDTKPIGGFQIGKLDAGPAATVVYMGPTRDLASAYQRVFIQMALAGLKPSGVRRERYLYTEDRGSANNIVLIEILLEK